MFGLLETLEKIGIKGLARVVQKNGGWPITMSRPAWELNVNKTWQEISDISQDNSFDKGLYSIMVLPNHKKSDTNAIHVCILFLYFTKYKI